MIIGVPEDAEIIHGECCAWSEVDDRIRNMEKRAEAEKKRLFRSGVLGRTCYLDDSGTKKLMHVWWWFKDV